MPLKQTNEKFERDYVITGEEPLAIAFNDANGYFLPEQARVTSDRLLGEFTVFVFGPKINAKGRLLRGLKSQCSLNWNQNDIDQRDTPAFVNELLKEPKGS